MTVAVVGAGIAGLSAAHRLVVAGHDVVVIEGADRAGGKLRRETVGGITLDVGAESLLARRPEAIDLCAELGLDTVAPATTQAGIWSRGAIRPIARGVLDVVLPDGHDVSVAEYVTQHAGTDVLDRLVEPLLGGVYAGDPAHLSLAATADSLRGLGPIVPTPGAVFAGLDGGVGRLTEELAVRLDVRLNETVVGIAQTADGWQVQTVRGDINADAVVVATPAPATARLLAEVAPRAAFELADVEVASVAIVTLVFDEAIDLPGSGFLVPAVEGLTIKGSTFSSNKWDWLSVDGRTVLRASVGRAGEAMALHVSDDELLAAVLADLATVVGPLPNPSATHVQRWGGGLPQYAVGHLTKLDVIDTEIAGLPGLELCGASYRGVGIAAVVADATRAAERISP